MADEKKFADEKLSDEQLEQVAGGTHSETSADSVFLKNLGLLDESYSAADIGFSSGTEREQKIYDAFQKLGIEFVWHGWDGNHYYVEQRCLNQKEAWEVAEENAKKLKLGKYSG